MQQRHSVQEVEAYTNLANAIIERACDDYRRALRGECVDYKSPDYVIAEVEQFFNSEWYMMLTNQSPEHLLEEIRREFE